MGVRLERSPAVTSNDHEVSVKWVSTVIRYLFEQYTRQVYFYRRVTSFLLSIFVEE